MQTYEKKTGQISTLSRVATNVTELQYEFWFQVLETINKSFGFVIALQMNNIVLKWLDKEEVNPYQFFVIFALIGISMIISRLREYWAFNMKEKLVIVNLSRSLNGFLTSSLFFFQFVKVLI